MSVRVKTDVKLDLKDLNKLVKKLENLETWEAKAGFKSTKKHPRSGESASFIASINNYGGLQWSTILDREVNIPARPFMNYAIEHNETAWLPEMATAFSNFIFNKVNSQQILRPLGKKLSANIEWALESEMLYQRNANLTIKLKGFDSPLYETGWLINNIDSWVAKESKEE